MSHTIINFLVLAAESPSLMGPPIQWDYEGMIASVLLMVVGPLVLCRGVVGLANGETGWTIAGGIAASVYMFFMIAAPGAFFTFLICTFGLPIAFGGLAIEQLGKLFGGDD